jgi:NADH:ubiquinone oxidoreductase subunit 2 (subunit N)
MPRGERNAALDGLRALAILLVINAAIAAAYYLRIIAAMYFRSTKRGVQADGGIAAGLAMLICMALLIVVTFQPRGLFAASSRAGRVISAPTSTLVSPQVVSP